MEGHTTAFLMISDDNPGMVIVGIAGEVVGAIPSELAPAWHDFTGRLAAEGLAPEIEAVVRDRHGEVSIGLYAHPEADYATPGEATAERTQRSRARVSRLHARATGRCRDCGEPIEPTGRGRPPVRCAACRGSVAPTAPAILASAPWPHEPAITDWSVLDLETTGLWPSVDRIVEIGVIRLAPDGHEVGAWTTLVDPDRDVGASEIHGLTAFDLRGAPRFRDLAPSLLAMLAGTRLAAHNARFDLAFLSCELARAGIDWGTPDALCTMNAASRLGLTSSRQLACACAELGIPHPDSHCAITDARAASGCWHGSSGDLEGDTVRRSLADGRARPAALASPHRSASAAPGHEPRRDRRSGGRAGRPDDLRRLGLGLPLACSTGCSKTARSPTTRSRLSRPSRRSGTSDAASVRSLHAAYLGGVWDLARADGVITDAEAHDLAILAELLGVSLDEPAPPPAAPVGHAEDLRGRSVCFTGASVVSIRGLSLERDDQERLAEEGRVDREEQRLAEMRHPGPGRPRLALGQVQARRRTRRAQDRGACVLADAGRPDRLIGPVEADPDDRRRGLRRPHLTRPAPVAGPDPIVGLPRADARLGRGSWASMPRTSSTSCSSGWPTATAASGPAKAGRAAEPPSACRGLARFTRHRNCATSA